MNNAIYFRFERQPLGEKSIGTVPGITPLIQAEFEEIGFTKAYHLLGQYLIFNKDNILLQSWLSTEINSMGLSNRQQCVEAISQWTYNNL